MAIDMRHNKSMAESTNSFKVFIEIPAGSAVKYEVDEETGELAVDRFMFTSFVYPTNYGYIQNTEGEDGDPLDALVLSIHPVHPGAVIKCHAVGLLEMEDEGGVDTKIIAVPVSKVDPEFGQITDIEAVAENTKAKIKHFFDHMKELEPEKWVKTGEFKGSSAAAMVIKRSSL